jgi:hypothetical protein
VTTATLDLRKARRAIAKMSDAERLEYLRGQVYACEEDIARTYLASEGLPSDLLSVRRLVFARELFMTLRLREHAL